jgi:hypothetical protein
MTFWRRSVTTEFSLPLAFALPGMGNSVILGQGREDIEDQFT